MGYSLILIKTGSIIEARISGFGPFALRMLGIIAIALQISGLVSRGSGAFASGFDRMDAVTKLTGRYLQRPLENAPVPKFDLRWL